MDCNIYKTNLNVLRVLWRNGDATAREIADVLGEEIGWHKNTTYTIIKKCIDVGLIKRTEPKFMCHPVLSEKEVQGILVCRLVNDAFYSSPDKFIDFLENEPELWRPDGK